MPFSRLLRLSQSITSKIAGTFPCVSVNPGLIDDIGCDLFNFSLDLWTGSHTDQVGGLKEASQVVTVDTVGVVAFSYTFLLVGLIILLLRMWFATRPDICSA